MPEPLTPHEFDSFLADIGSCRGPSEEEIRADERRKVAEELRALADPLRVATRAFVDRHPGLHVGVSVSTVLLAVADEIEGEARG